MKNLLDRWGNLQNRFNRQTSMMTTTRAISARTKMQRINPLPHGFEKKTTSLSFKLKISYDSKNNPPRLSIF